MTVAFIAIIACYLALLVVFAFGYSRVPENEKPQGSTPPVTVICCARNEAGNIAAFIETLSMQDYRGPLHLILVDDASDDGTAEAAENALAKTGLPYTIVRNTERMGKKRSIAAAMDHAAGIVVLRDADTYTNSASWLSLLVDPLAHGKCDIAIGPVALQNKGGLLSSLQVAENAALTVISCAAAGFARPFLASAANLAFTKKAFNSVGGFAGHGHLASGDDVLLLQSIRMKGGAAAWIKSPHAVVTTYPCNGMSALIRQKSRWLGKIGAMRLPEVWPIALIVGGANVACVAAAVAIVFSPDRVLMASVLVAKTLGDLLFSLIPGRLLRSRKKMSLSAGLLYPLYATTVGGCSFLLKPVWK